MMRLFRRHNLSLIPPRAIFPRTEHHILASWISPILRNPVLGLHVMISKRPNRQSWHNIILVRDAPIIRRLVTQPPRRFLIRDARRAERIQFRNCREMIIESPKLRRSDSSYGAA